MSHVLLLQYLLYLDLIGTGACTITTDHCLAMKSGSQLRPYNRVCNSAEITNLDVENIKQFFTFKNDDVLSHLSTLRVTSSKVLLFSEKLTQMAKLLSEMNVEILHAGLVCFIKERKVSPCLVRYFF